MQESSWNVGPDACVIYLPAQESVPPKLVMLVGPHSVTLVAPTNREDFPDFTRFFVISLRVPKNCCWTAILHSHGDGRRSQTVPAIQRPVIEVAWQMPGPDAPPDKVVEALRVQAVTALIYADVLGDHDKVGAAQARETACQLRCQAAVVEAMSALYDELGLRAQGWGEFAERMNKLT